MRVLKAKDKRIYERLFMRENNWHMMAIVIIYNYTHTITASGWLPRWPFFYFGYVGMFVIFRWDAIDQIVTIVCGS